MRKFLTIFAAFAIMSLSASAQTLGISYSPFGVASMAFSDGVYHYTSSLGGGVTYEFLTNGDSIMLEGNYSVFSFDKFNPSGEQIDLPNTENMKVATLMAYYGWTINKRKRIQFPIYAGLGVNSFDSSPGPEVILCAGLKARAKFYISNRFGIFAGVNASYGIILPNVNSEQSFVGSYRPISAEIGLMFDLLDNK